MSTGVHQRHKKACKREKRCRCPWAYTAEVSRGADGQRQQLTRSGFETEREARTERAKAIREHAAAPTLEDRRVTMEAYLLRWLARREDAGAIRPNTANGYRDHIKRFLSPTIGRVRLADLNGEHLSRAFRTIRAENPNLSPASLRGIHATVRAALRAAVKAGQISRDPSQQVELPRAHRPAVRPWQPAQFGAFLDHPDVMSHRISTAILVAGMAGLRRGEVAGLRWEDVDLDSGRLVVLQQAVVTRTPRINPGPGETTYSVTVKYTVPKTTAGEGRVVDLDAGTISALRAWRAKQASERLSWGPAWKDSGLVFTYEDGAGFDPNHLGKLFTKLILMARFDENGEPVRVPLPSGRHQLTDEARKARRVYETAKPLPHIRFHDLRHLQASLMLAAGVPMATVSKRLGHSTIAITVDTYGHMLDGIGSKAAEAAAALIPRRESVEREGA